MGVLSTTTSLCLTPSTAYPPTRILWKPSKPHGFCPKNTWKPCVLPGFYSGDLRFKGRSFPKVCDGAPRWHCTDPSLLGTGLSLSCAEPAVGVQCPADLESPGVRSEALLHTLWEPACALHHRGWVRFENLFSERPRTKRKKLQSLFFLFHWYKEFFF